MCETNETAEEEEIRERSRTSMFRREVAAVEWLWLLHYDFRCEIKRSPQRARTWVLLEIIRNEASVTGVGCSFFDMEEVSWQIN